MLTSAIFFLRSFSLRSAFANLHNSVAHFCAVALALLLLLCPALERSAAQSTSTAPIQTLQNHVRLLANGLSAQYLGVLPAGQKMDVAIVLPLRNEAQLDALLKRLYDPSSADYRKFLSVEEFTEQFGPTEADY